MKGCKSLIWNGLSSDKSPTVCLSQSLSLFCVCVFACACMNVCGYDFIHLWCLLQMQTGFTTNTTSAFFGFTLKIGYLEKDKRKL